MTKQAVVSLIEAVNTSGNLDKIQTGWYWIGIRIQDAPYPAVGDQITHLSKNWTEDGPTDEDLPGISAILLDTEEVDGHTVITYDDSIIDRICQYWGDNAAIIRSKYADYGDDKEEIIQYCGWVDYPVILGSISI